MKASGVVETVVHKHLTYQTALAAGSADHNGVLSRDLAAPVPHLCMRNVNSTIEAKRKLGISVANIDDWSALFRFQYFYKLDHSNVRVFGT
jgi:hypothetical protein